MSLKVNVNVIVKKSFYWEMDMQYVRQINADGQTVLKMDIKGLPIEAELERTVSDPARRAKLTEFVIKTYRRITDDKELNWDAAFDPVNRFLPSLSIEDQNKIAKTLILMHSQIINNLTTVSSVSSPEIIDELTTNFGKLLFKLDAEINLMPKIEEYVKHHVPIQSFDGYGDRLQDTPEMTFVRSEIVLLTGIVILQKLIAPIYGVLHEYISSSMDTLWKTLFCMSITTEVLDKRYHSLIVKIKNFLNRITTNKLNPTLTNIYNGITKHSAGEAQYSAMLVRWYVNVDIYKPNTNIMTYVTISVTEALRSQTVTANQNNSVMKRNDPADNPSEEGNASRFETESRKSSATIDTPIIVTVAVIDELKRCARVHDIDHDMLVSVLTYYQRSQNRVHVTPINKYLISIFYGARIGGARGIELVNYQIYLHMVVVLQAILIKSGSLMLANSLTVIPSSNAKLNTTPKDNLVRMTWESSYAYRNCKTYFANMTVGERKWDTMLEIIKNSLTMEYHQVNTAPEFSDRMTEQPKNGTVFEIDERYAEQICGFIYNHIEASSMKRV